jgi:DNA-binding CsgD family transcriptional regulator
MRSQTETTQLQVSVSDVHSVLGMLLEVLNEPDMRVPEITDESGTVLLDTEVNGERYLLVRMPQRLRQCQVILSPREQEIVRMVARGYPNKVIAGVLNISCWTVCTHLRRVFAKVGVTSRAAMVARLLEEGMLSEPAASGDRAAINSGVRSATAVARTVRA